MKLGKDLAYIDFGIIGIEGIYDAFRYDENHKPYGTKVENHLRLGFFFNTLQHEIMMDWVMTAINLETFELRHGDGA